MKFWIWALLASIFILGAYFFISIEMGHRHYIERNSSSVINPLNE